MAATNRPEEIDDAALRYVTITATLMITVAIGAATLMVTVAIGAAAGDSLKEYTYHYQMLRCVRVSVCVCQCVC